MTAPRPAPAPAERLLLQDALKRSRMGFAERVRSLLGSGQPDDETWEEVEEALISADLGAELAIEVCDRIAPEHLALHLDDADGIGARLKNYGALFVGEDAAEVLGDYGAGPNHTLPTGGTAKSFGALSVLAFLRAQTWLRIDDRRAAAELVADSVTLARVEGLEAHARAAEHRQDGGRVHTFGDLPRLEGSSPDPLTAR